MGADVADGVQHHCASDAVVQVGRDQAGFAGKGGHAENRCIADLHQPPGMGFVFGADIQVQVVNSHILGGDLSAQRDHAAHAVLEAEGGVQDALRPNAS